MFVDHIKIRAKAGDGGSGVASFRREKFIPRGGPDGGDGGKGGDIIFRADSHTDNLTSFFYEPIIKAKNGEKGMGKGCYGKAAKNLIVAVPIGTIIYRMPSKDEGMVEGLVPEEEDVWIDEEEEEAPKKKEPVNVQELEMIADLTEEGQEFVLRGGTGGKGNIHFKSSRNRVPRQFTEGEEGEGGEFYLELRKIADAALVGYPNAGKSTLLGKISAAHPKVAPYPFTTLHPVIGVVDFSGYARATVADIPGLIEGAHLNVGLGHDFLRHIVRCKLLIFVIDMAGSEGRSPIHDLASLRKELKLYDETLTERPWLVVANKIDLPAAEENLQQFRQRYERIEVFPIIAELEEGLEELKARLKELILPMQRPDQQQPMVEQ